MPVSHTQAYELVKELYPQVLRAREASWRAHMVELGRQAALAGVELYPEPASEYPAKALFDAVAQVCRLTPDPTFLHVEVLDEETGCLVKQPVLPSADNRADARVVRRVSGELGRRVGRHVLAAGREAVARSVENGSARYMGTRRPARVGYARVLTGKESCAFCAMLASRGAVYSSDTVVRRKDGRKYHDGCDCIPVLVVKGKPWEGQAEAEALYEAWLASAWGRTDAEQRAAWARAVRSGEIDTRKYSPFREKSPAQARRTVSLAGLGKSTRRDYLYRRYRPSGLDESELLDVKQYTDVAHRVLNSEARQRKGPPWEGVDSLPRAQRRQLQAYEKMFGNIDSAIEKAARVSEPVEVIRSLRLAELGNSATTEGFKPDEQDTWRGKEFKAWGYMSTSTRWQSEFGDLELRLTLPPGTKGMYVGRDKNAEHSSALSSYPKEDEYILGRQSRYRVNSVRSINGRTVIFAEVIGQDV